MKARFAALAAAALAAVTLSAGCNKETSNTNNASNTSTTTNAGPSAAPTAQPSPTPTSTTSASASTPTDAFKAYYEANKTKNVAALKRLVSRAMMEKMEEQAKQRNMTVDDLLAKGLESINQEVPDTLPEVRNEKIEGDTATLEINDEKFGRWETLHFIKEDGEWKLSF